MSRDPKDEGIGPFYNNPLLGPVVKSFTALPDVAGGGCMERVGTAAAMGLTFGIFYNLVSVPWQPDPVEYFPKGVIKMRDNWAFFRSGFARPMAAFSTVAMTYAGVECMMESLRDPEQTSPHWNSAGGGFAAGMVMGAMTKSFPVALVAGFVNGAFMGGLSFNGLHYISNPHQMAMKVGGKWPTQFRESKELAALKEKYPEYKDL
ncbi:expressed unknown protein [Seminavis robusta]|uniref:Mitochondrial import inner membrane translocase subunit TIM22 n=1 Tax=Seminavis robusta TaxID=568900 RepID=A0A9N8EJU5_9STRA|nr:expressed unknown protein [Seminavis robusta]|eukprot:Sro1118_g243060.1 n/a (205) ;mRNA; r:11162-11776